MSDTQRIKEALERGERTLTLRPERGRRVYRNVAHLDEGTRCHVEEADRRLTLDVGKALGGEDAGPSPSMMLRSAMTACVAIGVKQWAARRGIAIDDIDVTLETDIDARGQFGIRDDVTPGFEAIRLSIAVRSPAPRALIEDVVETSLRYSPLMDVFSKRQVVEHSLTVAEAA